MDRATELPRTDACGLAASTYLIAAHVEATASLAEYEKSGTAWALSGASDQVHGALRRFSMDRRFWTSLAAVAWGVADQGPGYSGVESQTRLKPDDRRLDADPEQPRCIRYELPVALETAASLASGASRSELQVRVGVLAAELRRQSVWVGELLHRPGPMPMPQWALQRVIRIVVGAVVVLAGGALIVSEGAIFTEGRVAAISPVDSTAAGVVLVKLGLDYAFKLPDLRVGNNPLD